LTPTAVSAAVRLCQILTHGDQLLPLGSQFVENAVELGFDREEAEESAKAFDTALGMGWVYKHRSRTGMSTWARVSYQGKRVGQ
jgi:hypothetical protein